jgi:hypothetical protein
MNTDEAYQHFLDTQLIGVAHHDAVTRKAFMAGVQYTMSSATPTEPAEASLDTQSLTP